MRELIKRARKLKLRLGTSSDESDRAHGSGSSYTRPPFLEIEMLSNSRPYFVSQSSQVLLGNIVIKVNALGRINSESRERSESQSQSIIHIFLIVEMNAIAQLQRIAKALGKKRSIQSPMHPALPGTLCCQPTPRYKVAPVTKPRLPMRRSRESMQKKKDPNGARNECSAKDGQEEKKKRLVERRVIVTSS